MDINGLETFLPSHDSFFSPYKDIGSLIGHNVLAAVKDICIDRMRIILSMKTTYEKVEQEALHQKTLMTLLILSVFQ